MQEKYFTLKEAAQYLKISQLTLRRAVWTHKIEVHRVGNAHDINRRAMRFTRISLDNYASNPTGNTQLA